MDEPLVPPHGNQKLPPDKKRRFSVMVRMDEADRKKLWEEAVKDGYSLGSELLHGWKSYVQLLEEENQE